LSHHRKKQGDGEDRLPKKLEKAGPKKVEGKRSEVMRRAGKGKVGPRRSEWLGGWFSDVSESGDGDFKKQYSN